MGKKEVKLNKHIKKSVQELEQIDNLTNTIDYNKLESTIEYKKFNEAYDNFISEKIKKTKKTKRKIIIAALSIAIIGFITILYGLKIYFNTIDIVKDISLTDYDHDNEIVTLDIDINDKVTTDSIYCSVDTNDEELTWTKAKDSTCLVSVHKDIAKYVYIKIYNKVLEPISIPSIIIKASFNDQKEEYMAINSTKEIASHYTYIGKPPILKYASDDTIISIDKNKITAKKNGTANLELYLNGEKYASKIINVSPLIVDPPKHFKGDKEYLSCNKYTKEQAQTLDKILYQRIDDAGYETRAGVVAAARFLTLEFPYRIHYFFENGRLNKSGVNLADGEGRYYHRGLYLDKDKFKDLKYIYAGPSTWGCPLTNYEDFGPYENGNKMPNGLDCSGFVTWALLNGGFDVGDYGAGETPEPNQMTDLGKRVTLTKDVVQSGKIKPGDLLNWWGHIAIIIGIDNKTYYVAESLDTYKGLVVKEYNKKTLHDDWTFVILMDEVYKKDGNLTNMWY